MTQGNSSNELPEKIQEMSLSEILNRSDQVNRELDEQEKKTDNLVKKIKQGGR